MELRDLHEVVWGDGYELYYVDDDATDPVFVGHFGYDDDKPKAYLGCTVVGVANIKAKLVFPINRISAVNLRKPSHCLCQVCAKKIPSPYEGSGKGML